MAAVATSSAPRARGWWRVLGAVVGLGLTGAVFVAATNFAVLRAARGRVYFSIERVPARDLAIVLGTSPKVRGIWANPFFESRLDAAAELWRAHKVRHFLLSGDNGTRGYDEPTAMRDALIARGVAADAITLDYAGFRTLDTMARAHAVFGQHSVLVVTDDFHLARSLFLAQAHGLDALGFHGVPVRFDWSKKVRAREVLSRTMAWLDVRVLHTKPKFYGPPVAVPLSPGETAAAHE